MANRLSRALLRCLPVLLLAAFLPAPFGIGKPASIAHFGLFLIAMLLGFGVTVAFFMMIYGLTFFTISPNGLRILITSVVFPLLHTLPYMGGCSTWQVILLFLQYVPAGFLLNIAYMVTESVYAPMAIHVALKAYLFIFYL